MTSQIEQQESGLQGHLPECPMADPNDRECCCCKELRACEERLRQGWCVSTCGNTHYAIGYEEGLDAAREAVAALESNPELEIDWDRDYAVDPSGATRNPRVWLRDAVAAIDALRVEQPPPLPPSVGVSTTPMWPAQ